MTVREVEPMATRASKPPKEKSKIRLHFPQDSKVQPKGFSDVSMKDQVTVIVKGPVLELSENAEQWDPGKRIVVQIDSCRIVPPEHTVTVSIDDAVKASRKKVS